MAQCMGFLAFLPSLTPCSCSLALGLCPICPYALRRPRDGGAALCWGVCLAQAYRFKY